MQIVDNRALVLTTDDPSLITKSIPKSVIIETGEVAVKWGLKEAQTLAALGFADVPSPIKRDYTWTGKFKPFAHQETTASFFTLHKRAFCFNEQGTGKTASVIWAADYLLNLGKIKRVLVLGPLSIMKSAWQRDLFTFAMHRSCSVAHGDAKQRKNIIAAGAEFVIINFDGVAVVKDEIIAGGFDLIVVDEANAYKNPQTNRWKVLAQILQKTDAALWMLTGTPAAQSPVDAFGLAKLVNPDGCPKYFGQFRDSVMMKVTQFKWAPRPGSDRIVHRVLQPAIRFEKKDCLDLPEVTYTEREAPLTPQQRKYYNELKNEMLIEAAGEEVSAVNAAAKINKLLQISGGAVYTDTKEVIEFDVSNRLNAVTEVIEEATSKVLVFIPFTHTIELLHAHLTKHKISCEVINGKVSMNKRSEIVEDFQSRKDPHVLLIQPQAASHGLTLTAADTIIWYAPVTSVETYLQANARINRPGQKNAMTIVHIKGSPVEERLYGMLRGNIENHEKIIDLYREMVSYTA
jgi:SNF2 family DNA or RNA helicase